MRSAHGMPDAVSPPAPPPRLQVSWPPPRSSRRSAQYGASDLKQARSPCPPRPACDESVALRCRVRHCPFGSAPRSLVTCPSIPLLKRFWRAGCTGWRRHLTERGLSGDFWTVQPVPELVRACASGLSAVLLIMCALECSFDVCCVPSMCASIVCVSCVKIARFSLFTSSVG